jgi:hypothetical protein
MVVALLSRSQEVTMVTRRAAVTACALCLAVPCVAGAQPIHDSSGGRTDRVLHGASLDKETPGDAYSQLSHAKALDDMGRQRGQSENASNKGHVDRVGSLTAEQLIAAYGSTNPAPATHASVASADDATNAWRIAAVTEAALLAALALASALIARARRRAPRMGM